IAAADLQHRRTLAVDTASTPVAGKAPGRRAVRHSRLIAGTVVILGNGNGPYPTVSPTLGAGLERGNLCDVLVKIGGSILDQETSTAKLVPHILELGRLYRIVIVTGGGQVAKRIKANQIRHGNDFYRFWRATGLCPEVNAYLLASYSSSFTVVSC